MNNKTTDQESEISNEKQRVLNEIHALKEMEQEVAPIIKDAKILINRLTPRYLGDIEKLLNSVYIDTEDFDGIEDLNFELTRDNRDRICTGDGFESLYELMAEVISAIRETKNEALVPFYEALSRKAVELEQTLKPLFAEMGSRWNDLRDYLRCNCHVRSEVFQKLKQKEQDLLPYADLADALSTEDYTAILENLHAHEEQQTSMQSPKVTMKVEKLNNDGCRETESPSNSVDMVVARSMVDLHTKTQNHYLGELLDHIADDELDFPNERAKGLLTKVYPLYELMEDRVHRLEKKLDKAKKKSAQCYQDVFNHVEFSSDVIVQVRQILAQFTDEELRYIANLYEEVNPKILDGTTLPNNWRVINVELEKSSDLYGELVSGYDDKFFLHEIIHTELLHAVFFRKRISDWAHTEEEDDSDQPERGAA